jgi:hypothetical protein
MNRSAALLAMTFAAAVAAQPPKVKQSTPGGIPPAGIAYNGVGIVRMLEAPQVQAELNLSSDVKANLPLLREELAESSRKFVESLRSKTDDVDAFRLLLVSHSRQMDKQMEELMGSSFPRFKQLRRRIFGIAAAMTADAELREAIAMTEDQRRKLNDEMAKRRKNLPNEVQSGGKRRVPKGRLDEAVRKYFEDEEKLFMEMLTEAQRAKWTELTGESFEIPVEMVTSIRRNDYESPANRPSDARPPRKRPSDDGAKPPPGDEAGKKPPIG